MLRVFFVKKRGIKKRVVRRNVTNFTGIKEYNRTHRAVQKKKQICKRVTEIFMNGKIMEKAE